jgi:hypothetical protein
MPKAPTQRERGQRAVKALPASIRVLGFDIAITQLSTSEAAGRSVTGEFHPMDERLAVLAEPSSAQRCVETFMHEVCHAIWWAGGLQREATEEAAVTTLGQGLMQVHRDNPWLADWLAEHAR